MAENDRIIIKIGTELNYTNIRQWRESAGRYFNLSGKPVYLDFKGTGSIDSSGISEIIKFNSRMARNENRVILVNLSEQIFKILKLVNVHKIIPTFREFEYALACENELLHFEKHHPRRIVLIYKDNLILEVLGHIIIANGYTDIEMYTSVREFLDRYKSSEKLTMVIISSGQIISTDDELIDELKKNNVSILISQIFNVIEKGDYTGCDFKNILKDVFNSIDSETFSPALNQVKRVNLDFDIPPEQLAKECMEYMGEFVHDISSPLNVFMNTAAMIEDVKTRDPELYGVFSTSFEKINSLVDEMRLFVENDDDIEWNTINAGRYFNKFFLFLKQIGCDCRKEISLEITPEAEAINIRSSERYLDHLFMNLATNGMKYGEDKFSIRVSVDDEENLRVCVYDDGVNIDPMLFFNTDGINYREINSTQKKGSGRGLKIIKKAIRTLGLRLEIENLEKGKNIIINIPWSDNENPS